jgi:hypothetical protein
MAKLRERLAVSKQAMHIFHMERFIFKKLNKVEGKEQSFIKISNRFAVDAEVNINRAWGTVRENIKIAAKQSLGLKMDVQN